MWNRWARQSRADSYVVARVLMAVIGTLLLLGWVPSATGALEAPGVEAAAPYRFFFPLMAQRWPPLPYQAALSPIDNADGDWFYAVSWPSVDLAETYVLEEDDGAGFSSPTTVHDGTGTSWSVTGTGKRPGTYYYRVRGHNQ